MPRRGGLNTRQRASHDCCKAVDDATGHGRAVRPRGRDEIVKGLGFVTYCGLRDAAVVVETVALKGSAGR